MTDTITIRKLDDGSLVLVGGWPGKTSISRELLEASGYGLSVDGDTVRIDLANGRAEYQITSRGVLSVVAELRQEEKF